MYFGWCLKRDFGWCPDLSTVRGALQSTVPLITPAHQKKVWFGRRGGDAATQFGNRKATAKYFRKCEMVPVYVLCVSVWIVFPVVGDLVSHRLSQRRRRSRERDVVHWSRRISLLRFCTYRTWFSQPPFPVIAMQGRYC